MVNFHHIMEEFHDIHCLLGGYTLVTSQQTLIVHTYESHATHRRSHHIVEALKLVFELLNQWYSYLLESAIRHRLSTACLSFGIIHVEPQMLQ